MVIPCSGSYEVHDGHPLYRETLQFFTATIAMTMAMRQEKVERAIELVIAEAQKMARSFNLGMPYSSFFNVDVPPLDKSVILADLSCPEMCVVDSVSPVVSYIQGQATDRPSPLKFLMQPRPQTGVPPPEAHIAGQMMAPWISDLSCYLIGGAYERMRHHFEAKYGKNPRAWAPELQFFRHLRNGCFHDNRFNIEAIRHKQKLIAQIDPAHPPQWRTYVMASDATMHGKQVIDGYFFLPHVLPFLHDIGQFV
jgi:hypothetical protein